MADNKKAAALHSKAAAFFGGNIRQKEIDE